MKIMRANEKQSESNTFYCTFVIYKLKVWACVIEIIITFVLKLNTISNKKEKIIITYQFKYIFRTSSGDNGNQICEYKFKLKFEIFYSILTTNSNEQSKNKIKTNTWAGKTIFNIQLEFKHCSYCCCLFFCCCYFAVVQ